MLRSLIICCILPLLFQLTSFAQHSNTTIANETFDRVLFSEEYNAINLSEQQSLLTASDFTDPSEMQDQTDERPLTPRLNQNFPNPFNPVTTISYRLPENSNVRIEVYDQLGRSVDVILNESRTAGEHDLMYDASHLTSGVYIYRMEMQSLESSNRQVFTRKFTLMK